MEFSSTNSRNGILVSSGIYIQSVPIRSESGAVQLLRYVTESVTVSVHKESVNITAERLITHYCMCMISKSEIRFRLYYGSEPRIRCADLCFK